MADLSGAKLRKANLGVAHLSGGGAASLLVRHKTIKAAAMISTREQAKATITISRTAIFTDEIDFQAMTEPLLRLERVPRQPQ